ncbi:MAG: hypothetical protein RRX95_03760 [Oscillospiraceae bacterium]
MKKFLQTAFTVTLSAVLLVVIFYKSYGISIISHTLKPENVTGVKITRTLQSKEESVEILPADLPDFETSLKISGFLSRSFKKAESFSPEYILEYTLDDGTLMTIKVDGLYVSKDGDSFYQHSKSDYATFKKITDGLFFDI